MTSETEPSVPSATEPDLVVLGSANADTNVRVARPPRRGETVTGGDPVDTVGGKGANQAVAAARLGLNVAMIGALGEDPAGRLLRETVAAAGVEGLWAASGRATGRALVLVDDEGDSTITVMPGANADVDAALVARHADLLAAAPTVLMQHEVPVAAVEAAAACAGGRVVLNPAPARPVPPDLLARVDLLVPNAAELAILAESEAVPDDAAGAAPLADRLTTAGFTGSVVVTLGAHGAVVVRPGAAPVQVPAVPAEVVDATAAGDTFCAALVDALSHGADEVEAARWAVRVAAVTVTRPGAADSVPTPAEVPGPDPFRRRAR